MVGSRYMYIMMKSKIITEQWVTENSSWLYLLVYFPVVFFWTPCFNTAIAGIDQYHYHYQVV